jgi:hypothetical protein
MRLMSSIVNTSGFDEAVDHQPVVGGLISAIPLWWRSKQSPDGDNSVQFVERCEIHR